MASMKDVSRACGVSIATVSKALNDQGDIGEETKKRIRRIAREMGYFPNSQARALKTNRTHNIGVLFVDAANSGLTHSYFSSVLDSFKRTVEEKGYDITFINGSDKGRKQLSILEHCRFRGFDGVVIACVDFEDPQVVELAKSGFPVVTIDYLFDNGIAVMSDNAKGMRDLVTYIYERGHRKIAYLHGADSSVTQKRVASFYRTAAELGLFIPDEFVREVPYRHIAMAESATKELLQLKDRPTCILYPDDYSCIGGINAIRELGLRIPEDVSLAGYDGISIGRQLEPKLTTIRQDTQRLGSEAAKRLISLIENPKSALSDTVMVGGILYTGGTVGLLRQSGHSL
ncbi:MAG: LacI family transcriptional regulator [Roseburia sp.]|nr:LacI family transcriptional regulator [Roseburia sp.]